MKDRKGFTLIELMVVVLIVGILAAVAIPILRGRIDAAKWSEGKAMMGSIATAIRAFCAEVGPSGSPPSVLGVATNGLGFASGDLTGTYFSDGDFSFTCNTTTPIDFVVNCDEGGGGGSGDPPGEPGSYSLDEEGTFTPGA